MSEREGERRSVSERERERGSECEGARERVREPWAAPRAGRGPVTDPLTAPDGLTSADESAASRGRAALTSARLSASRCKHQRE